MSPKIQIAPRPLPVQPPVFPRVSAPAPPRTGHGEASGFTRTHVTASGPSPAEAERRVSASLDAVTSAERETKALNEELAGFLGDTGAGLTEAEQKSLIKTFRASPDHKGAYDAVNRAGGALATELKRDIRALAIAAATGDPAAKKTLSEALHRLANSEHAKAVLEIVRDAAGEPNGPVAKALRAIPDLQDEVLAKALASATGQLLAETSNPKTAVDQLKAFMLPVFQFGWGPAESKLMLNEATHLLGDLTSGKLDPDEYRRVERLLDHAAHDTSRLAGFSRAMGAVTLVVAASAGMDAAKDGNLAAAISGFAKSGQYSVDLLAVATRSLGEASRVHGAAKLLARMAPALGAIASGASMANRIDAFNRGRGDVGQGFGAVGDALGVFGGVLECVPATAPAGALFSAIGGGVSLLGDGVSAVIQDGAYRERKTYALSRAGVKEPLLSAFGNCDGNRLRELKEQHGFSTGQIRALVTKYPNLIPRGDRQGIAPGQLVALLELKQHYHLTPREFMAVLDRATARYASPADGLEAVSLELMNIHRDPSLSGKSGLEKRFFSHQLDMRAMWASDHSRPAMINLQEAMKPYWGRGT